MDVKWNERGSIHINGTNRLLYLNGAHPHTHMCACAASYFTQFLLFHINDGNLLIFVALS